MAQNCNEKGAKDKSLHHWLIEATTINSRLTEVTTIIAKVILLSEYLWN